MATERSSEQIEDVALRARLHRALGDERRLRIVDLLQHSERSPGELARLTGLATNLLAFHLDVLQEVGLIVRSPSAGDARRRYVGLAPERLARLGSPPPVGTPAETVLFVCTANSARSQLAASLWHVRTRRPALSAGTAPASHVAPGAIAVARRHGLDLGTARPVALRELDVQPDLVVSVCDRANESELEIDAPRLHWSIADPVGGDAAAFEVAFDDIAIRIDRLASSISPEVLACPQS